MGGFEAMSGPGGAIVQDSEPVHDPGRIWFDTSPSDSVDMKLADDTDWTLVGKIPDNQVTDFNYSDAAFGQLDHFEPFGELTQEGFVDSSSPEHDPGRIWFDPSPSGGVDVHVADDTDWRLVGQIPYLTGIEPSADFSVSPSEPTTDDDVSFSASNHKNVSSYTIDYDDDRQLADRTDLSSIPDHNYASTGDYEPELTVENEDGMTVSYTASIEVLEPANIEVTEIESVTGPIIDKPFKVKATIKNTGGVEDTQTIEGESDSDSDTESVTVEPGDTESVDLEFDINPPEIKITSNLSRRSRRGSLVDKLTLSSTIENTGSVTFEGEMEMDFQAGFGLIGDSDDKTEDLTLDPGDETEFELVLYSNDRIVDEYTTVYDEDGNEIARTAPQNRVDTATDTGTVDPVDQSVTISSDDDSETETFEINYQEFNITDLDVPEPFEKGGTVTGQITIENTGGAAEQVLQYREVQVYDDDGDSAALQWNVLGYKNVDVGTDSEETFDVEVDTSSTVERLTFRLHDADDPEKHSLEDDEKIDSEQIEIEDWDLEIDEVDAPDAKPEETVDITVTVKNSTDRYYDEFSQGLDDDELVNIMIDGEEKEELTYLPPGETKEVDVEWEAPSTADTYEVDVQVDGDSATQDVTVGSANFDVSIDSVTESPEAGDTISVDVTVDNTGEANATQTITLDADGSQRDSTSISLDGDNSTTKTLNWNTSSDDTGTYDLTVSSDDDSATQNSVDILEPGLNITNVDCSTSDPFYGGSGRWYVGITVEATVENFSDESKSADATIWYGDKDSDDDNTHEELVTLDGDESTTVENTFRQFVAQGFANEPPGGRYDADCGADLEVKPAYFEITNISTNSPVKTGNDVDVTVKVKNTGHFEGTQSVSVDAGGLGTKSTNLTINGNNSTKSHTFSFSTSNSDAGSYSPTASTGDDSMSGSVDVAEEPTGTINYRNATEVGNSIQFYVTGGNATSYAWDWTNDGTDDATGARATHTYSSPGSKTVKLTASNDHFSNSTTKTLSIDNAKPDFDINATSARYINGTSGSYTITLQFDVTNNTDTEQTQELTYEIEDDTYDSEDTVTEDITVSGNSTESFDRGFGWYGDNTVMISGNYWNGTITITPANGEGDTVEYAYES